MAPNKFDRSEILTDPSTSQIQCQLIYLTIEFAVLGYLDIARRLVALLNARYPDDAHFRWKCLRTVWAETDDWPDGEWEVLTDEERKEFKKGSESESESKKVKTGGGKELRELMEEIDISDSQAADATSGAAAIAKSKKLVEALELTIWIEDQNESENNEEEEEEEEEEEKMDEDVPSSTDILTMISRRLHCNQQIQCLAESSRRVWKRLADGALAKGLGVKDEKARKLGKEVEHTFKERFSKGRQDRGWEKPMKQLLETCQKNTEERIRAEEKSGEIEEGTYELMLNDPASPEQITELEKRLGVQLPEDYKEFLRITNGLGNSWSGILMEPPLHACSEVRWIGKEEDYFTDISLDLLEEVHMTVHKWKEAQRKKSSTDEVEEEPKVGQALEIGTEDIDSVWLITPETVATAKAWYTDFVENKNAPEQLRNRVKDAMRDFAGSVEEFGKLDWCTVTWASGGVASMEAFPHFKALIAEKARRSGTETLGDSEEATKERHCFAYSCC